MDHIHHAMSANMQLKIPYVLY